MTLPRLDPILCTGCGDCVVLCPTQCLAMAELPWLPKPLECVACGLCELACPAGAIRLSAANPPGAATVIAVETGSKSPKLERSKKAK
jgi:NAD-dependent dihydropyrimidine dehydrogenase PreA subunit